MSFSVIRQGNYVITDRLKPGDVAAPPRPENTLWDKSTQNWQPISTDSWPSIQKVFSQAISENPTVATPVLQKELLKLADVVQRALDLNLFDAAREAINEPVLPPELEPYRDAILALIPTK